MPASSSATRRTLARQSRKSVCRTPLLNLLPYGGRRRARNRGGGEAETGTHDLPVDLIGAIERVIHSAFPCDAGVVVVRADGIGHGLAKAEAAQRARSGHAMNGEIVVRRGDIDVMQQASQRPLIGVVLRLRAG